MKKLLNTLFITTENAYATLDGENIVVKQESTTLGRFPLHILEAIYVFSYLGASPMLMGKCVQNNINLCFCRPNGRFLARTTGISNGNVLLRRQQYRIADNEQLSCKIARNMILGKINNSKVVVDRFRRDHKMQIDVTQFSDAANTLKEHMQLVLSVEQLDVLRGVEGSASNVYFRMFDDMILRDKEEFFYHGRSRRPPMDRTNALLSYVYSLLANDCASALEAAGLDCYVGFQRSDRAGRRSLALDLMEELRPCLGDRFVLSLINNQIIQDGDFIIKENGGVLLKDDARKVLHQKWQEKKKEELVHLFLKEKVSWGLIPYVQAILLARFLRGDLDEYPPFLWR